MTRTIQGVLPVLHTPFVDGVQIDQTSLQREVDWVFALGSDGLCAAMVSEILRLTIDERISLAHQLVALTDGRGVVITSVGAESSRQAIELAQAAERAGCDAVMAIPPLSAALSEAAIFGYFSAIAEAVDLPVIVQDASSYVGGAMSTALFVRLLDQLGPDKVLFKPEAAPMGPNLSALRDASQGRARIFDGSGGILLIDAYRRGIAGTMPGTDLLDGIIRLWRALQAGDEAYAYRLYFPICAIVALQLQAGLDGFLAIEKYLMVRRGIFQNHSRRAPSGWQLDAETRSEVDRLFDQLQCVLQSS